MNPTSPTENNQIAASQYFPEDKLNYSSSSFSSRLKKYYMAFLYYLDKVWPWIQCFVSFIMYNVLKVAKAIVRMALQQIGLMKE